MKDVRVAVKIPVPRERRTFDVFFAVTDIAFIDLTG